MKRFLLFSLLISITATSQIDLSTNYNFSASGKALAFDVSKHFNEKHEFGVGLRYDVNSSTHTDNQYNTYYRRLRAKSFLQHFGLRAFYHRQIFQSWETIEPFLFIDTQASYATSWNTHYNEESKWHGPYTWLEPSIGLGYKAILTNSFFIQSKLGFESMIVFGDSNGKPTLNLEFGYLFNFGIGYRL